MDYLQWPDYLILVAFLVISLAIGVYHSLAGGRQKTTSEFIMADRNLKVLPTSLSLLVSFQSAIKILGISAEMYVYGWSFFILSSVGYVVAIFLSIHVAVPWMFRLQLVSINEYFERRFKSRAVRIYASIISIFSGILYMGTAMYAPSAALQSVTGLPIVVSIPVMAIVSVTYTALGGMKAVIWTDVFQCVIMYGGMLAILIKGLLVAGGIQRAFSLCYDEGRLGGVSWSPDPTERHTIWGFLFGFSITWFMSYSCQQASVQRYSATKSLAQAKLTVLLNLPTYLILNVLVCFTGLVIVAYYSSINCDPLVNREISNANQLVAYFVVHVFANAPGFAGLFLATLYGGALSSISSSLSGCAANCWEDILKWKLSRWPESKKALFNRFLVVAFGMASTGFAFVVSRFSGSLVQISLSLNGTVQGPLFGMFMLGGIFRKANWKGALIGGISCMCLSIWIASGAFLQRVKHPTLPPLGIDGCSATDVGNGTGTIADNATSFYLFSQLANATAAAAAAAAADYSYLPVTKQTLPSSSLSGFQRLYSISYIWYNTLWATVTIIIGMLASLLFKDKSQEEDLEDELFLNYREIFCLSKWKSVKDQAKNMKDHSNYEVAVPLKQKPDGIAASADKTETVTN